MVPHLFWGSGQEDGRPAAKAHPNDDEAVVRVGHTTCFGLVLQVVPEGGLEPPFPKGRRILSPLCLPISPLGACVHVNACNPLIAKAR